MLNSRLGARRICFQQGLNERERILRDVSLESRDALYVSLGAGGPETEDQLGHGHGLLHWKSERKNQRQQGSRWLFLRVQKLDREENVGSIFLQRPVSVVEHASKWPWASYLAERLDHILVP
jgi:hypothetical protein